MQLYVLFIASYTLHVSGVTRPSSGVQETYTVASRIMTILQIKSGILFNKCYCMYDSYAYTTIFKRKWVPNNWITNHMQWE